MSLLLRRRSFAISLMGLMAPATAHGRQPAPLSSPLPQPSVEPLTTAEQWRRRFTPHRRLPGTRARPYYFDHDRADLRWISIHEGKGLSGFKYYRFDGAALPASFVTYDLPPGASEGVHTHLLDDPVEGSFDEFYYIVSGSGQMEIGDEIVPVTAGDHVFTPIGTPHGIENTAKNQNLKVFLTFVFR